MAAAAREVNRVKGIDAGLPVAGFPVAGLQVAGLPVAELPVAGLQVESRAGGRFPLRKTDREDHLAASGRPFLRPLAAGPGVATGSNETLGRIEC